MIKALKIKYWNGDFKTYYYSDIQQQFKSIKLALRQHGRCHDWYDQEWEDFFKDLEELDDDSNDISHVSYDDFSITVGRQAEFRKIDDLSEEQMKDIGEFCERHGDKTAGDVLELFLELDKTTKKQEPKMSKENTGQLTKLRKLQKIEEMSQEMSDIKIAISHFEEKYGVTVVPKQGENGKLDLSFLVDWDAL